MAWQPNLVLKPNPFESQTHHLESQTADSKPQTPDASSLRRRRRNLGDFWVETVWWLHQHIANNNNQLINRLNLRSIQSYNEEKKYDCFIHNNQLINRLNLRSIQSYIS